MYGMTARALRARAAAPSRVVGGPVSRTGLGPSFVGTPGKEVVQ